MLVSSKLKPCWFRVYAKVFAKYWGREALDEAAYDRGTKRQPQSAPRMLFSGVTTLLHILGFEVSVIWRRRVGQDI